MAYLNYLGRSLATPGTANVVTGSKLAVDARSVLTGTSGADLITPNAVTTMAGGLGNDTYQYVTMATKVVEAADGGIDTVCVNGDYVMPDNVENLVVWWSPHATGNALDNVMTGSAKGETLNGAGGNDVLIGKGGNDVFRFDAGSGFDIITDFATSGSDADMVRLAGYAKFTSFDQVKSAMVQSGSDVILNLDANNAIKFNGHGIADFTASNFELGLNKAGFTLTFNDDFNSLSLWNGSSGVWRSDYGYGATRDSLKSRNLAGTNEKEIYIDPTMKGAGTAPIGVSPFSINNGVLTITASPTPDALKPALYGMDYMSGLLTTKQSFAQQYGYFEARLDIPSGSGLWPAFWLLPADGSWPPELDVMENYGDGITQFNAHSAASGTNTNVSSSDFDPNVADGFHTYGMLWTKDTLSWYLDGVKIFETATPADYNKPMYMLVNLAVMDKAAAGTTGELKVDYIRAYSIDGVNAPAVQHLTGTSGNDNYAVTSTADTITEKAGGGSDTVTAYVDYTLGANVEKLILAGTAIHGVGNAQANTITGNALDNVLEGGAGNDTIRGGGGADKMIGGTGDDTYYVDDVRDVVIENANEGSDEVNASVDYTLTANVEDLTLSGTAIHGVGNDLDNLITGNELDNVLEGKGGNDILKGGAGGDRMIGGTGNDSYYVSDVRDVVIENAGEGTDTVYALIDYTLGANVEKLVMTGNAIRGTGNALANTITGNELDNFIDGGAGNDTLKGGGGHDTFIFAPGFGKDVISDFNENLDSIDWSALAAAHLSPTIKASGTGSVVSFGADTITLLGVTPSELAAHHIFG